jgi:hypothetical protein
MKGIEVAHGEVADVAQTLGGRHPVPDVDLIPAATGFNYFAGSSRGSAWHSQFRRARP